MSSSARRVALAANGIGTARATNFTGSSTNPVFSTWNSLQAAASGVVYHVVTPPTWTIGGGTLTHTFDETIVYTNLAMIVTEVMTGTTLSGSSSCSVGSLTARWTVTPATIRRAEAPHQRIMRRLWQEATIREKDARSGLPGGAASGGNPATNKGGAIRRQSGAPRPPSADHAPLAAGRRKPCEGRENGLPGRGRNPATIRAKKLPRRG
jgi:hypothetical protein